MYRSSDEPRFAKKRAALQQAFIELTLEERTQRITVKDLTDRAGVNRMTFYSHYDEVPDILLELVDELVAEITAPSQGTETLSIEEILNRATHSMQKNIDFYRLIAQDDHFELYRTQFRKGFTELFSLTLQTRAPFSQTEFDLVAGMLASAVTYAYLDWLAGKYEDISLDKLVFMCERFVSRHI